MQSPCFPHTYLFSHTFAIPPTSFPLIVVPSLPPPCPCKIHTLRRGGVVGLHQGVWPSPPPRGDAASVFAPPPPGDAASVFVPSSRPPPRMPPGRLSHPAPPPPPQRL